MNIKGNQVPSSKCITEKTYFNPIDTQSNYRASIMFHYAVYSSIRVQNKCILNYSNDCWEKERSFSIFKKYSCSYRTVSGILRSQETGRGPRLISGKASDHLWKENTLLFWKNKSSYICSQMTVPWIPERKFRSTFTLMTRALALTWLQVLQKFHFSELPRTSFTHCLHQLCKLYILTNDWNRLPSKTKPSPYSNIFAAASCWP